jgi:hypothetical protein
LNRVLLARCDALAGAEHWRKQIPIGELFAQDVAACLALPGVGFDPVRYERRTADKHGNIPVEGNTYAAGPAYGSRRLRVGLRHDTVEILDEHAEPVIVFARAFGRGTATVIDPARLVPLLIRKPGAWEHSLLRSHVPDPLRDWLDAAEAPDRARMLTSIHSTTGVAGFQATLSAAETLIRRGDDPGAPGLGMLARRLAQGEPVTAPEVDLSVYDTLVARLGQPA